MAARIERAGTAHAGVLAALHAASIVPAWSSDAFAALLDQPGVAGWIALDGNEPVGLLLARAAADEAEILTLAVLPAQRRQGNARRLIGALFDWAAAAPLRRLHLEVAEENAAARALYARCGFVSCGRRRDYYGPSRDALLLAADPSALRKRGEPDGAGRPDRPAG